MWKRKSLCVWCWAIWKETLFCVKLKKINNEPFKRNNSSAKTLFFPLSHVRETKSCFKHENNIFFSIFYFLSHVNEKKNLQEKKNCLKSFIILVTCKTNYSCPNFFFPPGFTRFSSHLKKNIFFSWNFFFYGTWKEYLGKHWEFWPFSLKKLLKMINWFIITAADLHNGWEVVS